MFGLGILGIGSLIPTGRVMLWLEWVIIFTIQNRTLKLALCCIVRRVQNLGSGQSGVGKTNMKVGCCEIHIDGKYQKWPCGSRYSSADRHDRYLASKRKCAGCSSLTSVKFCRKCVYKHKTHWLSGKKLPKWWKNRITNKFGAGNKHPGWKGGITPMNKRLRNSKRFKKWRELVFERDNFTCVECGARGVELHPDHIKPFSLFPELRFDVSNGRTLCVPCHKETPTWGNGVKKMTRESFGVTNN
jgi:hypothetical protein